MKIFKYNLLLLVLCSLSLYGMKFNIKNKRFQQFQNGNFKLEPKEKLKKGNSNLIGQYYYTVHALNRMSQRKINSEDITWVINHGNRYNAAEKDRQLCIDTQKELGIIINKKSKPVTVITVLVDMDDEALKSWIKRQQEKTE